MGIVRASLWGLSAVAGAGWLFCLAASLETHFGSTTLASTLQTYESRSAMFGTALLVVTILSAILSGPKLFGPPRPMQRAVRGAPRWLRRAFYVSLAIVMLAYGVHSIASDPRFQPHQMTALEMAFLALLLGGCGLLLVSAARLGLLPPKCPNGHSVGYDMDECSLCGAAIKNVEF